MRVRMFGHGSMAEWFRYIRNRSQSDAVFPLTPALSLGERENRRQSVGKAEITERVERCALLLPLPKGEGRGEGEQDARQQIASGVSERDCWRTKRAIPRVIALSFLLGALGASAVQAPPPSATPRNSTTAPGSARLGTNTLTPATPVASPAPAVAEEDIRDIRQPRHLPTPPLWAAVVAGVVALVGAFAVWKWLRRGRFRKLLPHELALQYFEEARRLMDPDHAREYCFAASNIIRQYIEKRFRLHAPRLTTEEFLRELVEVRETMLASQRALLGNFLEHCDLPKFAGWRYSQPDLEAMHASAKAFVQQTASATDRQREEVDPEVSVVCVSSLNPPLHAGGRPPAGCRTIPSGHPMGNGSGRRTAAKNPQRFNPKRIP